MAFVAAGYWDLARRVPHRPRPSAPPSSGSAASGSPPAGTSTTAASSSPATGVVGCSTRRDAERLRAGLAGATVHGHLASTRSRSAAQPKPPFMTSTLQQEGGRKLRLSAAQVMRVAQGLYERGYITYMRTDRTTLSETALTAARIQVRELYGPEYVPDAPRTYTRKVKNAQEAHEAIRPAGETFRTPDVAVAASCAATSCALYDLDLEAHRRLADDRRARARACRSASVPPTPSDGTPPPSGPRRAAPSPSPATCGPTSRGPTTPTAELDDRETRPAGAHRGRQLPDARDRGEGPHHQPAGPLHRGVAGEAARGARHRPAVDLRLDHADHPGPRLRLEEGHRAGPVVDRVRGREPARAALRRPRRLRFTARMEDDLDEIAARHVEREPWLHRFWFGQDGQRRRPVSRRWSTVGLDEIDAAAINTIPLGVDADGNVDRRQARSLRALREARRRHRLGARRRRPRRADGGQGASSCCRRRRGDRDARRRSRDRPHRVRQARPLRALRAARRDRSTGSKEKPRTSSLFKTMTLETITLDEALRLLSLPRVVGDRPGDGEEITAQNGRYGPYIKKGNGQPQPGARGADLHGDLDEALRIYAEPKRGRGQRVTAPLRELGDDPVSRKPVVVKDGRFGPYVTDGEINASLRRDDSVETITIERAAELLQDRRATAGRPRRRSRRPRRRRRRRRPRRRPRPRRPPPRSPDRPVRARAIP